MSNEAKKIVLGPNEVICREGDSEKDIYYVIKGKLLICSRSGHMVTPIAYINKDEYFGEMSFFDKKNRSADVITLEETQLLKIPPKAVRSQFPKWLLVMTRSMTKKLRVMDEVIRDKGIKRQNVETIKPLSIEDQRKIYDILSS